MARKRLPEHSPECKEKNRRAGLWDFTFIPGCPACENPIGEIPTSFEQYRGMGFTRAEAQLLATIEELGWTPLYLLEEDVRLGRRHKDAKTPLQRLCEIEEKRLVKLREELEANERKWRPGRHPHPWPPTVYGATA